MVISDNFNDIYRRVIMDVYLTGKPSAPRGMDIIEKIGYTFVLTNPTRSLCTIESRKLNYKFAMVEKLEYLFGTSSPERLGHYNKNMLRFINEHGEFDGAYGPRIKRQLNFILELLEKDRDSRQAIININNEGDKHDSKDIPCTVSLQFFVREDKLHMVTYMRSNDLLWGTPYDVNGFCFIQQALAYWLEVDLGSYTHMVGSIHIYQERLPQLLNTVTCQTDEEIIEQNFNLTKEEFEDHTELFWKIEHEIRERKIDAKTFYQDQRIKKLPFFLSSCLNKLL